MQFFETVTVVFETAGVAAMVIGFVIAFAISVRVLLRTRDGRRAFRVLRETIGLVILLGLEILVAADLVKTVTSTPSLTDAAVLAIVVLIRTILSFSLQVEIDGVVPWKRAFLTSPQLMARAVARESATETDSATDAETGSTADPETADRAAEGSRVSE